MAEPSVIDRFLAWIRALLGVETAPPPPPLPPGVGDCDRLLQYTEQFGAEGGAALFMREIQHRGGQEGFQSGGWLGAIWGGAMGTGEMVQVFQECKRSLGPLYQQAVDRHRGAISTAKATRDRCKAACEQAHPGGFGPRGRARRDCKANCERAYRETASGVRGGGSGDEWIGTFIP